MTIQEKFKSKLESLNLPHKEIKVYGGQIVITCHSRKAAEKWADALSLFSRVRGVRDSVDYAKENKGTVLRPSTIPVTRVFATLR